MKWPCWRVLVYLRVHGLQNKVLVELPSMPRLPGRCCGWVRRYWPCGTTRSRHSSYLQTIRTSKHIPIHSPTHFWSYLDPMLLPTGHSWQGLRCSNAIVGSAFSFGWPRAHCTNRTPPISWGKAAAGCLRPRARYFYYCYYYY